MALELSHQEVASAKPNHNANASKIRISHQHLVRLLLLPVCLSIIQPDHPKCPLTLFEQSAVSQHAWGWPTIAYNCK